MMNKEQRELAEEIDNLKNEMKESLDNKDLNKAKEIKAMLQEKKEYMNLYKETEITDYTEKVVLKDMENKNAVNELFNALQGKDYDNALVQRSVGANGGYLVPEEFQAEIAEAKRNLISLKERCRVILTETGKGVLPIAVEADAVLANLTEGQEIPQSQINFGQVKYDVKDYGDIVPVTRQMLQDEKCGVQAFITTRFSKKAVKTENKEILELLLASENKIQVAPADIIKGLNEAINTMLDPALNPVIIVNQDGFNMLDNLVDKNGRPMLQPMLGDETKKTYKGLEVVVMSNKELVQATPQFIVVDMAEAILFADRIGIEIAMSEEAGFTKNVVYLRVIERFDVQAVDKDAVCIVEVADGTQA